MKWDLIKLNKDYSLLKEKLYNFDSLESKAAITNELLTLHNMILEIDSKNQPEKTKVYLEESKEVTDSKCDFFASSLSNTTSSLELITTSRRLPLYLFSKSRISIDEYSKLNEAFLKAFKLDLNTIYKAMKENGRINIVEACSSNYFGICYYFVTLNKSYIEALFKNKVENCEFLIHEVGHAYLLDGTNYKQKYSMIMSSLGEAFPMFLQLAFYDYLINTKYFKAAINLKRNALESLASYYEVNVDKFLHTEEVKNVSGLFENRHCQVFSEYEANRFLSKVLAYYLLYLYRNNDLNAISKFNEMYKNGKEYEFYKEINPKLFKEALKLEFNDIYKSVNSHKNK